MEEPIVIEVPEKGVLVKIPKELNLTGEGEIFKLTNYVGPEDGFQPRRDVINLVLYDSGGEKIEWTDFGDARIELRIGFNQEDFEHLGDKVLQIAYWRNDKWNLLEYDVGAPSFPDTYNFGDLVVMLSEWGDPPIATGP